MMSITDNNFTGSECDHRSNSSKDCSDRYVNHWNNWGIYYLIIVYRLSLAVLTITTYLPDEYYQTIEPSYRIVFGKGIKYVLTRLQSLHLLFTN